MKISSTQVTKEWYNCKQFEAILYQIRSENPEVEFSRQEIHDRINRGEFGGNLIATLSPQEGSVEEILKNYKDKGQDWLDIQNLVYHYSHRNPNGNFHSKTKMLEHVSGTGANAVYKLHMTAFESK